jgi:hemoglobin
MKKNDISNRNDINHLVDHFYDQVKNDAVLGPLFQDIFKINWEKHLPIMYDFWDNVLFYSGNYNGNPMQVHKHLHHMHTLSSDDFKRWIDLFTKSVDQLFEGEQADDIKLRANNIAVVMQVKLFQKFTNEP